MVALRSRHGRALRTPCRPRRPTRAPPRARPAGNGAFRCSTASATATCTAASSSSDDEAASLLLSRLDGAARAAPRPLRFVDRAPQGSLEEELRGDRACRAASSSRSSRPASISSSRRSRASCSCSRATRFDQADHRQIQRDAARRTRGDPRLPGAALQRHRARRHAVLAPLPGDPASPTRCVRAGRCTSAAPNIVVGAGRAVPRVELVRGLHRPGRHSAHLSSVRGHSAATRSSSAAWSSSARDVQKRVQTLSRCTMSTCAALRRAAHADGRKSDVSAPTRTASVDGRDVFVFDGLVPAEEIRALFRRRCRRRRSREPKPRVPRASEFRHWVCEMPLREPAAHRAVAGHRGGGGRRCGPSEQYQPYRVYTNYASYGDTLLTHVDALPNARELTALWFLCETLGYGVGRRDAVLRRRG